MTTADSCSVGALHDDGRAVPMIPLGGERRYGRAHRRGRGRCHDCGVVHGGFHHLGCDVQECPCCGSQMMTCGCRFDEDADLIDEDLDDGDAEPVGVDATGGLVERIWVGGTEVLVHHADIPDKDLTVVRGIPCTTALRTIIDLAPEVDAHHLAEMLDDALTRRLFTVAEARARLAEPDLERHPGAPLVQRALDAR